MIEQIAVNYLGCHLAILLVTFLGIWMTILTIFGIIALIKFCDE